mmetsp:Transcript_8042/g.17447  ORF Transcript_8042/g.17447 Transcript_8042/m.17447 type:complete len:230 (+) Transcript_8042:56-745(+)
MSCLVERAQPWGSRNAVGWEYLPTKFTFIHFSDSLSDKALGRCATCPQNFAPAGPAAVAAARSAKAHPKAHASSSSSRTAPATPSGKHDEAICSAVVGEPSETSSSPVAQDGWKQVARKREKRDGPEASRAERPQPAEDEEFNVMRRLLVPGGGHMSSIAKATGARLCVRGQGSGHPDGDDKSKSADPLSIWISPTQSSDLPEAKFRVESLLAQIQEEYRVFRASPRKP